MSAAAGRSTAQQTMSAAALRSEDGDILANTRDISMAIQKNHVTNVLGST